VEGLPENIKRKSSDIQETGPKTPWENTATTLTKDLGKAIRVATRTSTSWFAHPWRGGAGERLIRLRRKVFNIGWEYGGGQGLGRGSEGIN